MKIIRYEDKYRDDMIFMYLTSKNAIGRIPKIKEDLLDIEGFYFNKGGYYWLAIDDNDRVIGCVGITNPVNNSSIVKHLFIMPNLKRQGLGSKLYQTLEDYAKDKGIKELTLHLGNINDYFESRFFYKSKGFFEYKPNYMKKILF